MKGENLVPIPGELNAVDMKGRVASAEAIYDYTRKKNQEDVNKELYDKVSDLEKGSGNTGGTGSGLSESQVQDKITAAINALDATSSGQSSDGKVKVQVTEQDGKVTGVSVTTNGIASDSDIAEVNRKIEEETKARENADNRQNETISSKFDEQDSKIDENFKNQEALINEKQLEIGAMEFDVIPTKNSGHGITSGGVYNAIVNGNIRTPLEWSIGGINLYSEPVQINIQTAEWAKSNWSVITGREEIYVKSSENYPNIIALLADESIDTEGDTIERSKFIHTNLKNGINRVDELVSGAPFVPKYIRIYVNKSTGNFDEGTLSSFSDITINTNIFGKNESTNTDIFVKNSLIEPSSVTFGKYLNESGELQSNDLYYVEQYNVEGLSEVVIDLLVKGTSVVGCFAMFNSSTISNSSLNSIVTIKDIYGSSFDGATSVNIFEKVKIPEGVVLLVMCRDTEGISKVYDTAQIKDYIEKPKYVDCLGDSLTMGASWLGWYEDTLQDLLGKSYKVRNWGVGGEPSACIMARQGSDPTKFSHSFVLKSDCSKTLVMSNDGTSDKSISTQVYQGIIPLLLQGTTNDEGQRTRVVNPCYINGIECEMTFVESSPLKGSWYINRRYRGERDVTIPEHTPIYFNTGKEMAKSHISIIWMGTNDGGYSDWQVLVDKHKMVVNKLSNKNYIIIGLHTISKENGEAYEALMRKEFGTKFFNIREYMSTSMIYDAGLTPNESDISAMQEGRCPPSLMYDGTHLNPTGNKAVGRMLYNLCVGLGYVD